MKNMKTPALWALFKWNTQSWNSYEASYHFWVTAKFDHEMESAENMKHHANMWIQFIKIRVFPSNTTMFFTAPKLNDEKKGLNRGEQRRPEVGMVYTEVMKYLLAVTANKTSPPSLCPSRTTSQQTTVDIKSLSDHYWEIHPEHFNI